MSFFGAKQRGMTLNRRWYRPQWFPAVGRVLFASNFVATLILPGTVARLQAEERPAQIYASNTQIEPLSAKRPDSRYRGWDHLVARLRQDGISDALLADVYQNPLMPRFTPIPFSVQPREPAVMYRGFLDPAHVAQGQSYLQSRERVFIDAERELRVSRFVVAAILFVESRFGKVTGRQLVVNRLSRLSALDEPNNLVFNLREQRKKDRTITMHDIRRRAAELTATFHPELLALFEMARRNRVSLVSLRGSYAGAFGIPQFLPRAFLRFGIDGDRDDVISLFSEVDAIWSVANFLSGSGWREDGSIAEKRAVIWKYNHSEPYIDTVLGLAERLAAPSLKRAPPR